MDFRKITKLKVIMALALFIFFNVLQGQVKKPTLMILPSDNWCEQRYFMTEFDNQGSTQKVPNYKQAFQEDTELGQVISKIGSLMIDRGFPLKDAEQELKAIEARNTESNMISSTMTGSSISESPLDQLKKKAKSDIIIQIWWKVTKSENGKVVSFVLEAFDAYTSKRIAASQGNSEPNNYEIVPVMLERAVLNNIDQFVNQLQIHFSDMLVNGREILMSIKRWDNWEYDLETMVDGDEVSEHIIRWLQENTVNGRFNVSDVTENFMLCEQVRIPLYDSNGNAIDARQFAKGLQRLLKSEPFNYEVKLMTRGLGEAIIIIGER